MSKNKSKVTKNVKTKPESSGLVIGDRVVAIYDGKQSPAGTITGTSNTPTHKFKQFVVRHDEPVAIRTAPFEGPENYAVWGEQFLFKSIPVV